MKEFDRVSEDNILVREFAVLRDDIQRFLLRKLKHPSDVDDVLHDTYVVLVELKPKVIAMVNDPRSYIFRIAYNTALALLKEQNRFMDKDLSETSLDPIDQASAPDQIMESRQRYSLLEDALKAMPAKRRQVFLLYRFHNLAVEDVAHELEMSIDAVEKNIVRAMAFCREWLGKRGEA